MACKDNHVSPSNTDVKKWTALALFLLPMPSGHAEGHLYYYLLISHFLAC